MPTNWLARDVCFSLRLFAKSPGFAAIAITALALAIAPNTAIFSIVYADLLAPLPYPNPDQLAMVWSKVKGGRNQVTAADFTEWQRESRSFQGLAAFSGDWDYNLSAPGEAPQYVAGNRVSSNWFSLFGNKPAKGRVFRLDDGQPGNEHVFVLSHRSWISRFGGDPNIIGKQFRLNGELYAAIGVMSPGAWDRHDEEIWTPLVLKPSDLTRGAAFWQVVGRLRPGISIQQAQQEMNAVARRIAERYPDTNKDWGISVEPLKNDFQDVNTRSSLWLALAAVGFVLLIACVNVANLLLALGTARRRELAIRQALGASRIQIAQQLFVESLTLAACGGLLGSVLAGPVLKGILMILPGGTLSSEADVRLNLPVLLFTILATLISGVLFGCAPALQTRDIDVNEGLRQGVRSVAGRSWKLRQALVLGEFALALTLLAGAALTIHSFLNRTHIDLGVRTDRILTFHLPVPQEKVTNARAIDNFYRELVSRLEAVPGVQRASAATGTPLNGTNFDMEFTIAGRPPIGQALRPEAGFQAVTPGFFQTFGARMDRGRAFTPADTATSERVAMVNGTFVGRHLKGLDPLRQRLRIKELGDGLLTLGPEVEWRIVGVFQDVQNNEQLGKPNQPEIYVPFAQSPWPQAEVAVRSAIDPLKLTKAVSTAVLSVDPDLPITQVKAMNQIVSERFVGDRFATTLYGSLAGLGLIMAALGIYGVVSYTVSQRTSEIGIRMALGASRGDVLLNAMGSGLRMAVMGLALGLSGAYGIGHAMQGMLYNASPLDLPALSAVTALLLAAALLACYIPARRATAVDPMVALRTD